MEECRLWLGMTRIKCLGGAAGQIHEEAQDAGEIGAMGLPDTNSAPVPGGMGPEYLSMRSEGHLRSTDKNTQVAEGTQSSKGSSRITEAKFASRDAENSSRVTAIACYDYGVVWCF